MRRGLVLGKFMPMHKGHISLIEHALKYCDVLIVWVCVSNKETMSGKLRLEWVRSIFKKDSRILPILFEYNEAILPNSSESSRTISLKWSEAIREKLPPLHVIISSEKYGNYVAEYLNIEHVYFPNTRNISASLIRSNPYKNWEFVPDEVKPYFFRKVCLLGTESTGKSMLTHRLARHFCSDYVSEAGRDIAAQTTACQFSDLLEIAKIHADKIRNAEKRLNKIVFIDTDITITKSYSKFLFNRELIVDNSIITANKCDLYLYLEKDAPYIQDGTRLEETERNKLDVFHKNELEAANIGYFEIRGNWDSRFEKALSIISTQFGILT